jgi:hypothetical protein
MHSWGRSCALFHLIWHVLYVFCFLSLDRYGQGERLDDEGRVEMAEDDIQRLARERAAALLADEEERKYEEQYGGDGSKKDKKKDKNEANMFESPLAKLNGTTFEAMLEL